MHVKLRTTTRSLTVKYFAEDQRAGKQCGVQYPLPALCTLHRVHSDTEVPNSYTKLPGMRYVDTVYFR